ncbi:MAG: response regulator [Spirochaetaceae bacterium]|nr:response regulator [Spirochaetaceae bacterium]MCF7947436.1 response regulator [Spirochaetia bacterium]MCF7952407.1 response regulator [Spirochaetaceae bacterium]
MSNKIFLVEDEMILNEGLKRFLQKNGYPVEIFAHGEPCLERLDSGPLPALILMDINLGKGRMDGPSVTKKIYEKYDIPVVLHSAYTDKATLDTTRDMTKYGYIQKVPGNEQFILATIDMALKLFESKRAHIKSENKYKELLRHQQNIREEQNAFIAQEVHDELGQSLTSLQMGLAIIESDFSTVESSCECASIQETICEMKETLEDTIKRTRELSWQLKPVVLDSSGIIEALGLQVSEYKRKLNLPVTFIKPRQDCTLDKNKSLAIYRIAQEALTNCARYAGASEVGIEVLLDDEKIEVLIKDNGIGFDPKSLDLHDSFGLVGMKERAKQFGGNVSIKSEYGIGTEVHMQMPINGDED